MADATVFFDRVLEQKTAPADAKDPAVIMMSDHPEPLAQADAMHGGSTPPVKPGEQQAHDDINDSKAAEDKNITEKEEAQEERPALEDVDCKATRGKSTPKKKKKDLSQNLLSHEGPITTLMIRNLPCGITQQQVAQVIDELGYARKYDLIVMPSSGRPAICSKSNLGYGFVNFADSGWAESFAEAIKGYRFRGTCSNKVCTAQPAHVQGFRDTLEHFKRLKRRCSGSFMCTL